MNMVARVRKLLASTCLLAGSIVFMRWLGAYPVGPAFWLGLPGLFLAISLASGGWLLIEFLLFLDYVRKLDEYTIEHRRRPLPGYTLSEAFKYYSFWGCSISRIRYVLEHPEAVYREVCIQTRTPDFVKYMDPELGRNLRWLADKGYLLPCAVVLPTVFEVIRLERTGQSTERELKKIRLSTTRITKENVSSRVARSMSEEEVRAQSKKERREAALKHLSSLAAELPPHISVGVRESIKKLEDADPDSRSFRVMCHDIEGTISALKSALEKHASRGRHVDTSNGNVALSTEEVIPGVAVKTGELPTRFKWQNDEGEIEYSPKFLKALEVLHVVDREVVVKQLWTLAYFGPEYPSLKTKRIDSGTVQQTPVPCFSSRGARQVRFTWTKDAKVAIHFVFRRVSVDYWK